MASDSAEVVSVAEVHRLVQECMESAGTDSSHAAQLAEVLAEADTRGHFSHGTNRLQMYVNDVRSGAIKPAGSPSIIKETPATAFVDGQQLLGAVVGNFCTDLAVAKAKAVGVGWVVARNSSHFGIAGHYCMRAAAAGAVALCFTNASPILFPTRAAVPALGTNPIAAAVPAAATDALATDQFVLDMATSAVAYGKVEMCHRKQQPIPLGWACDASGHETNDPAAAMSGGGVQPLGGSEASSGYKGYGLALLVELLCGGLSGGPMGPDVRAWQAGGSEAAELGQCFVAVDPDAFAGGFAERAAACARDFRDLAPLDPERPVLVPGDPERSHLAQCQRDGGVRYHANQILHLRDVAALCGVKPLQFSS